MRNETPSQDHVRHWKPEPSQGRRLLPRVASRFIVRVHSQGLPGPVSGMARDVGPGGLCLETPFPFAIAAAREIVVDLRGSALKLKVEGRWQRDAPGCAGVLTGLKFVDLATAETQHLWSHVYHRAAELASFLHERSDLAGIDHDDAIDLALFSRLAHFRARDVLYHQGTLGASPDSAYVLYKGSVMLEARTPAAGCVYSKRLTEGAAFGATPIVAGVEHPETASADTDVLLIEIDSYGYDHLEMSRPRAVRALSRALTRRSVRRLQSMIQASPRPSLPSLFPSLKLPLLDDSAESPAESKPDPGATGEGAS